MNNCKTCKYWGKPQPGKPFAVCDLPDTITGEKLHKAGVGMEINATADDDSNMQVEFLTGENFGCIQHNPKP